MGTRKPTPVPGKTPRGPLLHRNLSVSFQYFIERDPFVIAEGEPGYVKAVMARLRDICSMTASVMRAGNDKSLRSHAIEWADTTEKGGFDHLNPQMRGQIEHPWQFNVSANKYGRIHGFWIGDVLFVVWFDPEHRLYE